MSSSRVNWVALFSPSLILDRRRRSPNAVTYMYSVGQQAIMYDIDH